MTSYAGFLSGDSCRRHRDIGAPSRLSRLSAGTWPRAICATSPVAARWHAITTTTVVRPPVNTTNRTFTCINSHLTLPLFLHARVLAAHRQGGQHLSALPLGLW